MIAERIAYMTSSHQIDEELRALRYSDPADSPLGVLLDQMRKDSGAQSDLLAQIACEYFELAQALEQARKDIKGDTANEWQAVEIIVERLAALLAERHVQVLDPTGQQWADSMKQEYELIGSVQRQDVDTPAVSHTSRPLVKRFDQLVRKGQVVVEAPAQSES